MNFKVRRVLVAVADGSAKKVVDRVAQIARTTKAHIELFSVVRPPPPVLGMTRVDDPKITRGLIEQKRRQLMRLAARLSDAGITASCAVAANASVLNAIVKQVKKSKADLVAIELHKHSLLERLFLSQHDYDLIRHCPVPLWIVKRGKIKPRSPILAALDPWHSIRQPQELDGTIAAAGHGLAEALGAKLHSVHAYAPLMGFATTATFTPIAVPISLPEEKQYVAALRRNFAKVNEKQGIDKQRCHLRMGDPAFILPNLAKSLKAQILVMGAISRSAVGRLLIGSTAERVLDSTPCDILIVKPKK